MHTTYTHNNTAHVNIVIYTCILYRTGECKKISATFCFTSFSVSTYMALSKEQDGDNVNFINFCVTFVHKQKLFLKK